MAIMFHLRSDLNDDYPMQSVYHTPTRQNYMRQPEQKSKLTEVIYVGRLKGCASVFNTQSSKLIRSSSANNK